jgi:hypothetical protein
MADSNMADFYRRVSRIEKMRSKGYGFEADGTLGRSHYRRPKAQRRSLLGPVLFVAFCVFLMKGMMYHEVGAETYNARVASLMAGDGVDHFGGLIMQAEPATVFIAGKLDELLLRLK